MIEPDREEGREGSSQRKLPVRFGVFEVDLEAGELRKNGLKAQLPDQPFRILAILLERPGQVVSRDELKERLWPADTYVDFDHGLNTAIRKLRRKLGDSADSPRYLETIPRRGYRFIAPVERIGHPQQSQDDNQLPAVSQPRPAAEYATRSKLRVTLIVLGTLLLGAVLGSSLYGPRSDASLPLRTFAFEHEEPSFQSAISPNGRYVAYWIRSGLRLKDLSNDSLRTFEGIGAIKGAFFSPDSRWIGFHTVGKSPGQFQKIAVDADIPVTVSEASQIADGYGSWDPKGTIIFAAGKPSRLFEVSASGGEPILLFHPSKEEELDEFFLPHFLPPEAGRILLYNLGTEQESEIVVHNLETGERTFLGKGFAPVYSPTGHILYQTERYGGQLMALPFSLGELKARGEPFPLNRRGLYPSVADDGTLAFTDQQDLDWRLALFDRGTGEQISYVSQAHRGYMVYPAISPNGRYVAAEVHFFQRDIWLFDLWSPNERRLTVHPEHETTAVWWADSKGITFASNRSGSVDIYSKRIDDGREAEKIVSTEGLAYPGDWSPDGKHLIYHTQDVDADLWLLTKGDGQEVRLAPFLETQFDELEAQFSPDGRRIVYCSNQSGRFEVYVVRFPEGDRQVRISHRGGSQPRWGGDGRELFYVEDETLMVAPVEAGEDFGVGQPRPFFSHPILRSPWNHPKYDVSADGNRFLIAVPAGSTRTRIIQNWYEEFREREQD